MSLNSLIYSQLVRSTGDNLGLHLASKCMWGGGRQSCGTWPLTCEIWPCLQAECVRTELNDAQLVLETWLLLWETPPHIWWLEGSEVSVSSRTETHSEATHRREELSISLQRKVEIEFFLITETEWGNWASSIGCVLAIITYSKRKEGWLQQLLVYKGKQHWEIWLWKN